MKKYRVTVNGAAYEVELEEMTGAVPTAAPAPVSVPPRRPPPIPTPIRAKKSRPPCPVRSYPSISPPGMSSSADRF